MEAQENRRKRAREPDRDGDRDSASGAGSDSSRQQNRHLQEKAEELTKHTAAGLGTACRGARGRGGFSFQASPSVYAVLILSLAFCSE